MQSRATRFVWSCSVAQRRASSIFDPQLQRCSDSVAVLRAGSSSRLLLSCADLQAFFSRVRSLGSMPRAGADVHAFVNKVEQSLPSAGVEGAALAVSSFAELSCRQGALTAWPYLRQHLDTMSPVGLVDAMWAISAVPKLPPEEAREVVGIIWRIQPAELPEIALYRSLYGLARVPIHHRRASHGQVRDFLRCSERRLRTILERPGQCVYSASQLVRIYWSVARLGTREDKTFMALERHLRPSVSQLKERELQALYGILTDLKLQGQWRLIFDVERALAQREESADTTTTNTLRKQPFRRKWTKPTIVDSVVMQRKRRKPR